MLLARALAILRMPYVSGDIEGHYNGPHDHSSPPDLQADYRGDFLDIDTVALEGPLRSNRLSLEWLQPVHPDVNGYPLDSSTAPAPSTSTGVSRSERGCDATGRVIDRPRIRS